MYADTKNLLTIVDSANAKGRIYFIVGREVIPIRAEEPLWDWQMRTRQQAMDWVYALFKSRPLLRLRLDLAKNDTSKIDLTPVPYKDCTVVGLNLAKLLQLPAEAPAKELAVFRELLVKISTFFDSQPSKRRDIQVCGYQDSNCKVYGALSCRVQASSRELDMQPDEGATQALLATIDGNEVLKQWLENAALALQKVDSGSCAVITKDDHFGIDNRPNPPYPTNLPEPAEQVQPMNGRDVPHT